MEYSLQVLAARRVDVGMLRRNISKRIARDVIKTAAAEGRVQNRSVLRHLAQGDQELEEYIAMKMYTPNYDSLIYVPAGEHR